MSKIQNRIFGGKTALVLENTALIAMDLEACLRDLGFRKVTTSSALVPALRALHEMPVIDIALLNFSGLGERAAELILSCRERNVPFAMISGYFRDSEITKALEAVPVLLMPFTRDDLAEVVARCFGKTN